MPPEDKTKLAARLRGVMEQKLSEAKSLQDEWAAKDEPMPEEVSKSITALYGEFDQYKAQLDLVLDGQARDGYMNDPAYEPKTADISWRPSGPDEGDEDIDVKSWRSFTVKQVRVDPVYHIPVVDDVEIRYHVPLKVSKSPKQSKAYASAFEGYIRHGVGEMGPNDRKTLTEGADSAGGFTVPEDYQTELIKKMMTQATIRARARVATTSRDIAKWPKIHYTTDNKWTSGVRMTWTGESPSSATAHRVTDPVFGLYSIPVHTAMASMPISNDLIEDSAFDIVGISADLLSEAFTLGENDAFINGNGIGRPMGILTQVDGDGPASVATGTASTLLAGGLIDLAYALPAQYEANATWTFAKSTEKAIRKLADSNGDYLWPVWPQVGNLGVVSRDLLGFPTMRDEFMPAVAAGAYPIIFGDLRGYLVLDRVGISVQRLTEIYAETNVTLLLARKRLGGQTIEPWRLLVQKVSA